MAPAARYRRPIDDEPRFRPEGYRETVRAEIPGYDRLQDLVADAAAEVPARRILDLGSGTGETAARVAARHPGAELVGVDESDPMLAHARARLPGATFVVGRLEDPLPEGPFDLVVSAFAIHHLEPADKADLFDRVAAALSPGGRLVVCDVVEPTGPVARPVPRAEGFDRPSSVGDHLGWLRAAGLHPEVRLAEGDLAVIVADRPADPESPGNAA